MGLVLSLQLHVSSESEPGHQPSTASNFTYSAISPVLNPTSKLAQQRGKKFFFILEMMLINYYCQIHKEVVVQYLQLCVTVPKT